MQSHAEDLAKRILTAIPNGTIEDGDVLELLEGFLNDDLICERLGLSPDAESWHSSDPLGLEDHHHCESGEPSSLARKACCLITVDICRAAAVEQLAGYADLLNAPLEVVKEASQLAATVDRLVATT